MREGRGELGKTRGFDRDRGDMRENGKNPTKLGILRKIVRMPKRYLLLAHHGQQ